jgi:hypothetical protein
VISLTSIAAAGFLLGMRHATDADHVIAISTIVSRERSVRGAGLIGALWGIGHTLTIVVVGGAILLFSLVIPPHVGLSMEFAVGVMLVILGIESLPARQVPAAAYRPVDAQGRHLHIHRHGDFAHSHVHGHGRADHGHSPDATPQHRIDRLLGRLGWYRVVRPVVVGIVHGLAGSAAVVLLLIPAVGDPLAAMGYLVLFGFGTVAGMMMITSAIALPFALGGRRYPGLGSALRTSCGLLSLGFGLFVMYTAGVADGLLTGHAHWIPG